MGSEFLEACERIDPESAALQRKVALQCVAAILGDEASAVSSSRWTGCSRITPPWN